MSKFQNIKIFIIFFLVVVAITVPAQAQVIGNLDFLKGIVPCGTSYASAPCTVCHFYKLLENIINFFLYTAASLATLMATIIAFLFLFSGGSPQKITDAKSKLRLLVWGIIVVLGSWLVINTILNFVVNPQMFPLPWNKISCEISQPSGGGNTGGGNTGGGQIDFSDHIFEDVRADINLPSREVKITDETTGRTADFDLTTEGAGIALVREKYPNVFIMGERDLSLQDATRLKTALDEAAAMLPESYDVKNKIIFVPTDKALAQNLWETAGGKGDVRTQANALVGKNAANVIVFNGVAYAQNDGISLTAWEQKFPGGGFASAENNPTIIIVHELAHVMAGKVTGDFDGDADWTDLHYGIETQKTGFITGYAKTNAAEDLAETIAVATLALNGKAKAYTGDSTTDTVLQKKYEYLKNKGLIKDMPPSK